MRVETVEKECGLDTEEVTGRPSFSWRVEERKWLRMNQRFLIKVIG